MAVKTEREIVFIFAFGAVTLLVGCWKGPVTNPDRFTQEDVCVIKPNQYYETEL